MPSASPQSPITRDSLRFAPSVVFLDTSRRHRAPFSLPLLFPVCFFPQVICLTKSLTTRQRFPENVGEVRASLDRRRALRRLRRPPPRRHANVSSQEEGVHRRSCTRAPSFHDHYSGREVIMTRNIAATNQQSTL